MIRFAILFSLALAAQGQSAIKAKPADYPAQGSAGELTIGAEYLVRSVPGPEGVLTVPKYLVTETGFFGPGRANLAPSYFSIRINGGKAILAQQPFVVMAGMEAPPDDRSPGAAVSTGNIGVIFGPNANPRPSDPGARRIPDVQRIPDRRIPQQKNPGINQEPPLTAREVIERAALPIGDVALPVSGVVFFGYTGKTEDVRSLELIYEGPAGKVTIRLR